jgi:hypothetical protein
MIRSKDSWSMPVSMESIMIMNIKPMAIARKVRNVLVKCLNIFLNANFNNIIYNPHPVNDKHSHPSPRRRGVNNVFHHPTPLLPLGEGAGG